MVVYFGLEVEAALKDYLELSRNKITPLSGHENALFLSGQRKRISVDAIEKMVKKYSSAISVKTITPHKLRSMCDAVCGKDTFIFKHCFVYLLGYILCTEFFFRNVKKGACGVYELYPAVVQLVLITDQLCM